MKKFLIIKPSSLGDVLHAFPAVSLLASGEGTGCEISWLIQPAFSDLLDYLPFVKKKIFFERKELGKFSVFPGAVCRLLSALREEKYDAVYDLQGLLRSALISFLTRSPLRYGPENPREKAAKLFYNRKMSYPEKDVQHAADKLCCMISHASSLPRPEKYFTLPVLEKFRTKAWEKAKAKGLDIAAHQKEGRMIIAVAPGARWESKTWGEEYFVTLIKELHAYDEKISFLFLGTNGEKESIRRIKEELAPLQVTDLSGETGTGELVELIRAAGILLCNDSGPMHIAAFTQTVPVAFFGPTDPVLTGPCCKNALVFQAENLPCIKCFKKNCSTLLCHRKIDMAKLVCDLKKLVRNPVAEPESPLENIH